MWNVRSLCFRTDLVLARFDGVVEDRGDWLVVRTPTNPDYWWGNFLLSREPPGEGAFGDGPDSWPTRLERELSGAPVDLVAWDRPDGARGVVEPALACGFELDEAFALTATNVTRPSRYNERIAVEPLRVDVDRDWQEATTTLVNAFAPNRAGSVEALARFVDRQMGRYRAMQRASIGRWFAARVEGEIAGVLGLVRADGLGRFQLVGTDPRFAGQGVCSTLLFDAARWGLEREKLETLVIVTAVTNRAANVYESVGFTKKETLIGLLRKPPPS